MVKTVVVPLDGSDHAETALGTARWLAEAFDADLLLFTSTFALDPAEDEQYLHRVISARDLPRASVEVAAGRSAGPAVVNARRGSPDSIVCMATHGRTGLRAVVLGSVADEVVRDLGDPVVLIGPSFEPGGGSRELLVCWDGSDVSATIAPIAAAWAAALDLAPRVLAVRSESEPPILTEASGAPLPATEALVAILGAGDRPVQLTELVDSDPAGAIAEYAASFPVALVALATQGRSGIASSALGRVAAKIVNRSPRPLLVHHPRG